MTASAGYVDRYTTASGALVFYKVIENADGSADWSTEDGDSGHRPASTTDPRPAWLLAASALEARDALEPAGMWDELWREGEL